MFDKVVALYRAAGCPPISDNQFIFRGPVDGGLLALINDCRQINSEYGRFTYERIKGDTVEFEFFLPSSDSSGFYASFEELIRKTPSLGHGVIPQNIYITADNWSTTDDIQSHDFEKIKQCCRLIKSLSKIVMLADEKSNAAHINLIFAVPADNGKPPKTFTIATRVHPEILNVNLTHLAFVDQLANPKNEQRIHLEERKSIFNLAVSEIIRDAAKQEESKLFLYLLTNWKRLLDTYWKNFQTYIHGFSFDKAKKDLAQAELEYGAKLSTAFSDIGGKLLALPISLGALVILQRASTPAEAIVTAAGILMVSLIFSGILANQWLNVARLTSSLNIAFSQIEKRIGTYPKNLQNLIKTSKEQIDYQRNFVEWTLRIFFALSWIPTIGMVIVKWDAWFAPKLIWLIGAYIPCDLVTPGLL